jgi:hypothetical protein
LEDVADYYTFYVLIVGIPADVFWEHDCAFVNDVAMNLSAYNGWKNYAEYTERKRIEASSKRSH